jgi:hypothetical protein
MSKMCLRRISNEIEGFNNKRHLKKYENSKYFLNFLNDINFNLIYDDKYNENKYYLQLFKNTNYTHMILELRIPKDYPFAPYRVMQIDNINYDYLKYLNNVHKKIVNNEKEIYNFFFINQYNLNSKFLNLNTDCFCCHSITCGGFWSPGNTCIDMIFEYNEIKFIEKYSSKLMYKYIKNIYQKLFNESYFSKLSDDLLEKIFN